MTGDESQSWFLVDIVIIVGSALSWTLLLFGLHWRGLPVRMLFPRQLRSLAIAGLGQTCTILPIALVEQDLLPQSPSVCDMLFSLYRTSRFLAALLEIHIAAAFFAQCRHWLSVLHCLDSSILWVWVLGLFLGVVDAFQVTWTSDGDGCFGEGFDKILVWTLGTCIAFALITCAELFRSTWFSLPDGVRQRSYTRAAGYPVIALAVYLPWLLTYANPSLLTQPPWFTHLAACLGNSTGILNGAWASYSLGSAKRRRGRSSASSESEQLSCNPPMSPSVGMQIPTRTSDVASWHVLFLGADVELLDSSGSGKSSEAVSSGSISQPELRQDRPDNAEAGRRGPSRQGSGDVGGDHRRPRRQSSPRRSRSCSSERRAPTRGVAQLQKSINDFGFG